MEGILCVDKPAGVSSARVVARVKRLLPHGTKIGHAGTLDPFATGVLLLLVGRATKQCERLMDQPKQYEAVVKFGATTETDDPESPERPWPRPAGDAAAPPPPPPTRDRVEAALAGFVGEVMQRPPAYSAMKVGGRRAYDLARKGQAVAMRPRPVKVHSIEVLRFEWPSVTLRIDCGRGTYVRSIARDLGEVLGVGGYLTALRRTRVGPFNVDAAVTPDDLDRLTGDELARRLAASPPPSPGRGDGNA